jgi:hypothetical protein
MNELSYSGLELIVTMDHYKVGMIIALYKCLAEHLYAFTRES